MTTPCVILAGGLGTRLKSVVPDLPKCLAPIAGRPFIEWQLCSLAERGIESFVLALGYGAERVVENLKQPWARRFSINTVIESELLGTGGSAHFAMHEMGLEEALVVNGDTFVGGGLSEMLVPLDLANGELMRLATVQVANRSRFGGVAVDVERHVTAFLEKGLVGEGKINAGMYRVNSCVFYDEKYSSFSMETQVMPYLVSQNALQARELTGPFIDIGVPDDYYYFNQFIHEYGSEK